MKNIETLTMKTIRNTFFVALAVTLFAACSSDSESNADDGTWKAEQAQMKEELNRLGEDMKSVMEDVEDELDINEGPIETAMEDLRESITGNRSELDKAMDDLNSATEENWSDVKAKANATAEKMKGELERLKSELNEG